MTAAPGDIGLVPISGEVGRLIRLGQFLNGDGFDRYQHAFLYSDYEGHIIEAAPGGARMALISKYNPADVYWCTGISRHLTAEQRQLIVDAAVEEIGTPYSALDYFALAAHRLHIPAPLLREYIATSKHMICSQLCDYSYEKAGVQIFDDFRWDGYVTPGSLYQRDQVLRRRGSA